MNGVINYPTFNQSLFKVLIKKILLIDPYNKVFCDSSSKLESFELTKKQTVIFAVKNSNIKIGKNVCLNNVTIDSKGNSKITICDNVKIQNASIKLSKNSNLIIGSNCILGFNDQTPLYLNLSEGNCEIGENSKLKLSKIQVRFGGSLKIGRYAGFGQNTDIRCDEKITIGDFCLCSYNVSIFDTNVHSLDPEERKVNIINQFPSGLSDIIKPKTSPVILGENIWIGKNASVLKGSHIATGSIIGMNAVISNVKEDSKKTFVAPKPITL